MLFHDLLVAIPYVLGALFGLLIVPRWVRLIKKNMTQRRARRL